MRGSSGALCFVALLNCSVDAFQLLPQVQKRPAFTRLLAESSDTLSAATLESIASTTSVAPPKYDRSQVKPGIVHVGVGNFYVSHIGTYVDDYLNTCVPESLNWGIVGGSIKRPFKRNQLEPQDWLQTLVKRDGDGVEARIIGSLIDFAEVSPPENAALLERMCNAETKIVSMTVTEGGYYQSDGQFDVDDPDIQHDGKNPDTPTTLFGLIVKALKNRKEAGIKPFTVMTCDNVPHNGDVLRGVVTGLARLSDPALADWIDDNVAFPNSMVDRITPATSDDEVNFVKETYGYSDAAPVFCEPFLQWVLEDKFCNERPALEDVDVTFVEDVTPYETAKIRILNGGHASLCYPSALLGVKYVHESMEHPTIGPFLDALEKAEIIPTVPPVPDTDLQEYWKTIAKRFANPTINDTIDRNCYDGASRHPKFIVPVAAEGLKAGNKVEGLALVAAMWCRYCQGKKEDGSTIEPNDPIWDDLQARALKAKDDPAIWLQMKEVYGEVGENPVFIEAFSTALNTIESDGVEGAMKKYIESA